MCRLFAYIGKPDFNILKRIGHLSEIECGGDGNGVLIPSKNGKEPFSVHYSMKPIYKLVSFVEKCNAPYAFFHTRKATRGKTTLENCHPLLIPNTKEYIIHNGIIEAPVEYVPDSKYLGELLLNNPDDIDIWGYGAAFWTKEGNIYVSNLNHELSYVETEECLYIASSDRILRQLFPLPTTVYDFPEGDVYKLEDNYLEYVKKIKWIYSKYDYYWWNRYGESNNNLYNGHYMDHHKIWNDQEPNCNTCCAFKCKECREFSEYVKDFDWSLCQYCTMENCEDCINGEEYEEDEEMMLYRKITEDSCYNSPYPLECECEDDYCEEECYYPLRSHYQTKLKHGLE